MYKYIFSYFLLVSFCITLYAQDSLIVHKEILCHRINQPIKIDGLIDEEIWKSSEVTDAFVQRQPNPNIEPSFQSEVRILHDDEAIYIAAYLYDDSPELIMKQLSERDELPSVDWFAAIFDTYKGGVDGVGFVVSAAGVQLDTKYSQQGEDASWDAVWESAVQMQDDGWSLEYKIPYAALRFPEEEIQEWSVNFGRQCRRLREVSWWNPITPEVQGFLNQAGNLTGIQNIKPPVRLSITPYVTTYLQNQVAPGAVSNLGWSTSYNAGLDLKYGINDAFTLDMILIPDFGQVSSDQLVLNLSPFEQFLQENRLFFTEGVEIFNKGGFFYSRRIGGSPINRAQAFLSSIENEATIIDNPVNNQLYNATKISGRNSSGTGIGFFNAVEGASSATLQRLDGSQYQVETNPLTNYNVLVLDQNLRNNSSISLINTNVLRRGSTYDANLTGLDYNLNSNDLKWNLSGKVGISQRYFSEYADIGHTVRASISENQGKFVYGLSYAEESPDYNPNDLGFLFNPNERSGSLYAAFNQFEPIGIFNRFEIWGDASYGKLYDPNLWTNMSLDMGFFALTKKIFAFGSWFSISPKGSDDYFEARVSDFTRVFHIPTSYGMGPFISTNYDKPFAFDLEFGVRKFNQEGRINLNYQFRPRYRFSDKFFMQWNFNVFDRYVDEGWVNKLLVDPESSTFSGEDILFGQRDRLVVTNTISGQYIFNNVMSLAFRVRHYWDKVDYTGFGLLNNVGSIDLIDDQDFLEDATSAYSTNFNLFNIDVDYRWRFAPGSDLFFVWRQSLQSFGQQLDLNYVENLRDIFQERQSNSFSIRLVYFLDYNQVF